MLTTTIKLLKKHKACEDRFVYLVERLTAEEKAGIIPLWRGLEVNGIDDCLWAFRALSEGQDEEGKRLAVEFADFCAEQAARAARLAAALAAKFLPEWDAARDAEWAAKFLAEWDAAKAAEWAAWAARAAARAEWAAAPAAARKAGARQEQYDFLLKLLREEK